MFLKASFQCMYSFWKSRLLELKSKQLCWGDSCFVFKKIEYNAVRYISQAFFAAKFFELVPTTAEKSAELTVRRLSHHLVVKFGNVCIPMNTFEHIDNSNYIQRYRKKYLFRIYCT